MSSIKFYSKLIDEICLLTRNLYTLFLESQMEPIRALSGFLLLKYTGIIIKLLVALANDEVPPMAEKTSELELSKIKEPRDRFSDVCWLIVNMFKLASITQDKQKRNELLLLLNRAENIYLDLVLSAILHEGVDNDKVDEELTKIKEELQEVIKV